METIFFEIFWHAICNLSHRPNSHTSSRYQGTRHLSAKTVNLRLSIQQGSRSDSLALLGIAVFSRSKGLEGSARTLQALYVKRKEQGDPSRGGHPPNSLLMVDSSGRKIVAEATLPGPEWSPNRLTDVLSWRKGVFRWCFRWG